MSSARADDTAVTGSFSLRDARPEDAADITRLVHDLAVFERIADEALATPEQFHEQLFGEPPNAYAMVAEIAGRVVGVAIWFYNFSTFQCRPGLYVEDVYVEPEHRGLGIGRAFFRGMAQRALRRGCSRMEWSVLDWNETAVKFYRSMGAVGMEDWTVQRLSAEKVALLARES